MTHTFGYDVNGQQTSHDEPYGAGAATQTWNRPGHLAAVSNPAGATGYLYTGDGHCWSAPTLIRLVGTDRWPGGSLRTH